MTNITGKRAGVWKVVLQQRVDCIVAQGNAWSGSVLPIVQKMLTPAVYSEFLAMEAWYETCENGACKPDASSELLPAMCRGDSADGATLAQPMCNTCVNLV